MIYILQLPKPSDNLINLVKEIALSKPLTLGTRGWRNSKQNTKVNSADADFSIDDKITYLGKQEFQSFFKEPMSPIIGIFRNTDTSLPAVYPPHTDRYRSTAINYYIELGGDNVNTVFYDKRDQDDDMIGGNILSYNQLQIKNKYKFETGFWYLLDSKRFHSVENIMTSRIILGLSFVVSADKIIEAVEHSICQPC
jgi:hypothetical protein